MRSHTTGRLSSEAEAWKQRRGRLAEVFVRRLCHGRRATPRQDREERWDVRASDGERLDVKSTESFHTFVDGGDECPRFRSPIVEVDRQTEECRLLGIVESGDWTFGTPESVNGIDFRPCWHIDKGPHGPVIWPWPVDRYRSLRNGRGAADGQADG